MVPTLVTLGVFQFLVLGELPDDPAATALGLLALLAGLMLFVRGLETSLFPLGERLVDAMALQAHPAWLLGFAFALGFGSTAAEPALAAVAAEAAAAMVADAPHALDEAGLRRLTALIRYGMSLALGLALLLGVWRILKGWPLTWLVLPGYGILACVALFTESPHVAVALDTGTAATSAINVPLMLALGTGLASVLRGRNALVDGFGMVVLASLMPTLLFVGVAVVVDVGG